MNQEKRSVIEVTAGIMLCFLLFGYCDAIRGASLTDVISTFGVGYSAGGLLMVMHFVGYSASPLIFGALAGKIQKRIIPIIANIAVLLGVFIYVQTGNLLIFSFGVMCIGFGLGLYEFAGNTIVADIYPEEKRGKFSNLVAGMHGIGAIIGPALFGLVVERGGGYKSSFGMAVPIMLVVILLFLLVKYPKKRFLQDELLPFSEVLNALKMKAVRKYYALSTLYIAVEAGVVTWMTAFFVEEKGYSMNSASLKLSLFFVFLTIGRFAGSLFVDKVGYKKTLLCGFLSASLCIMFGIILPDRFAVLLPLSGLFLSVLFPTLVASVSIDCEQNTSVCMGAFFAFAALGGAVGSYAVGQISQIFGVKIGLISTVLFCLTACVIVWKTFVGNNQKRSVS